MYFIKTLMQESVKNKGLQKSLQKGRIAIASQIDNQITSNKLYSGRDSSISLIVYSDGLTVNIDNQAIFTVPIIVKKILPRL